MFVNKAKPLQSLQEITLLHTVMAKSVFIILTIVAHLGVLFSEDSCEYFQLMEHLNLTDSVRFLQSRPVDDWRKPSQVFIDSTVANIIQLEGMTQSLTSLLWLDMKWKNSFISWDPNKFCGMESMTIPLDLLWLPDLYIYEVMDGDASPVVNILEVKHDGSVKHSKPIRLVSACTLDIFGFPFDTQKCTITFGPYVHTVEQMTVLAASNSSVVTQRSRDNFSKRGEWELLHVDVQNRNLSFSGILYSQVKYTITLKRIPIVYVVNLICPAGLLIILDFSGMFISVTGGERLGFKITVVLGFLVLLLILNDQLPKTDVFPILGVFCGLCFALMIVSIMGTVGVLYMVEMSSVSSEVPSWMKKWVLKHMAKALLVKTSHTADTGADESIIGFSNSSIPRTSIRMKKATEKTSTKDSSEAILLKKVLLEILMIRRHLANAKLKEESQNDWHMVAYVLDRFICIFYFFSVVISMGILITVWAIPHIDSA
ncbi:5-hydroxytryptamine receptor 3A-like isoform X1 [Polyodon spathula]|uniref:5-hydroxytryptamine receptor 3A-like isoform X1 n=2 Tax=Polyodon spathula TaxID=7913 RepID=UPI001B7E7BD3|nr:5-hydroxytryptamine receptor 3A-like isoform X1 [Polyodon spathula]